MWHFCPQALSYALLPVLFNIIREMTFTGNVAHCLWPMTTDFCLGLCNVKCSRVSANKGSEIISLSFLSSRFLSLLPVFLITRRLLNKSMLWQLLPGGHVSGLVISLCLLPKLFHHLLNKLFILFESPLFSILRERQYHDIIYTWNLKKEWHK